MSYVSSDWLCRRSLPGAAVVRGDVRERRGDGYYQVGELQCASLPVNVPRDCEHARWLGSDVGPFVMIQPSANVHPFLVKCDMTSIPGVGSYCTSLWQAY